MPHDVVGSHDTLRHGLPAFKNDVLPVHPVEVIQRTVSFCFNRLLVEMFLERSSVVECLGVLLGVFGKVDFNV